MFTLWGRWEWCYIPQLRVALMSFSSENLYIVADFALTLPCRMHVKEFKPNFWFNVWFFLQNAWTGGYIAGTSIGLRSKENLLKPATARRWYHHIHTCIKHHTNCRQSSPVAGSRHRSQGGSFAKRCKRHVAGFYMKISKQHAKFYTGYAIRIC